MNCLGSIRIILLVTAIGKRPKETAAPAGLSPGEVFCGSFRVG